MRPPELMRGMDITEYLRKQKVHLSEESKHVKDFSVFDFDYLPEQPLLREEAKTLVDDILRFELSGIPTHYAIIGSRGSGKTLTLKYLARVLPEQTALEVLYVNCRQHNTSFKILARLLEVQARGTSLVELFEAFCARQQKRTVVVLDEIDLMSPKDRRREILYLLSRSQQPFMVVMLSNNPHVLQELDAATRSSLQPVPLHFRNYNAEQIRRILQQRAERGLRRWDAGQIAEIAAHTTSRTNADVRVAIKTLYYSVTRPQRALRDCFEDARRDLIVDMVNDLSDATLHILGAIASAKTDLAKDIYTRYCRLSQAQAEKPFSYVHFYSNLGYLQSSGLATLLSTKVGRTYTNRVLLAFDASIAREICRLRFDR